MKRSAFMTVAAVVAFLFGLGFLLAPAWTMSTYGITLEVPGQWIGRYLGSAFVGIAVLTWLARKAEAGEALRAVMLGDFVLSLLGLVVAIFDAASGLGNSLVWTTVLIYVFLTVGFGYYHFLNPD
jgi:hypothetical protein